jgi:hypothetical protein
MSLECKRAAVQLSSGTQEGAHAAFGVRGDEHQASAGLTVLGTGVREVGGHTVAHQVFCVEVAQLVVRDPTRVKCFAAQLCQRHHGIARRTSAVAASRLTRHVLEQSRAAGAVDQSHVALVYTHLGKVLVKHLVFGVDQGVADGVQVVVGHVGRPRKRKNIKAPLPRAEPGPCLCAPT